MIVIKSRTNLKCHSCNRELAIAMIELHDINSTTAKMPVPLEWVGKYSLFCNASSCKVLWIGLPQVKWKDACNEYFKYQRDSTAIIMADLVNRITIVK